MHHAAFGRFADEDPYAIIDFPSPVKVPAKSPSRQRRKSLSLVRGRRNRATMVALGVITEQDIINCFAAMVADQNRLFLEFQKKNTDGGRDREVLRTLMGGRWDYRPFNLLSGADQKKLTELTTYGLRLHRRGKALGVRRKIRDDACLVTLTFDPRRFLGFLYFGFQECFEHGDPKAIQERMRVDKIVAEEIKAEYRKAKEENRKPKPISAESLGLKKPSPWKVYEQNGKRTVYKPSFVGRLAMRLCDKLSTLNLTFESLSLRAVTVLLVQDLFAEFRTRYEHYMAKQGCKSQFVVSALEPHRRTGLPHVHVVFNQKYVAPIELLTEWWPWGSVVPKSSYGRGFRQKAHDAINYAVKYTTKAARKGVTLGPKPLSKRKQKKKKTDAQFDENTLIEYVNLFYAFVWYFAVRLHNFAHALPVEQREPEWLCIGVYNGQKTHIFCRYRDDYKDSGTDYYEADGHDPPSDGQKRSFTLSEAQAFLDELCNKSDAKVYSNVNDPVNDND